MDLNEAAQRIFKYHWVLILVLTLLGLAVPAVLAQREDEAYVASARIEMGDAARDTQEANALADTALALASSPGAIEQALEEAKVERDTSTVAGQVRVEPVGSSGVLELSVTDSDPQVSASLANALAAQIVQQREDAVLGRSEALLAETDEQIGALVATVAALENEADAAVRADAAARARGEIPGSTLPAITLRHSQAVEQLSRAQAQRQELLQTLAQVERPRVVDSSASFGSRVETALPARLAVGALLGLLLGVALAATLEAWRPTLSPTSLARHLGVPLLGTLRRLPERAGDLSDKWIASYVALAADGAGVRSFELVPVGPQVDVTGLARTLAAESGDSGQEIVPVALDGPHDSRLPARLTQPGTGIVVVAPKRVRSDALASLERHAQLTRQPVIGVIGYGGKARPVAEQPEAARNTAVRRPVQTEQPPATATS